MRERTSLRKGLRLPLVLTALLGTVGVGLAVPPPAAAAASGCSGTLRRTLTLPTGTVRLYKDSRYVCGMTVPARPGTAQRMSMGVRARGGVWVTDRGTYRYHAGPVRLYAGHRCVQVRGSVGTSSKSSGWILC